VYEETTSAAAGVSVTKRVSEITIDDIASPTRWWDPGRGRWNDVRGQRATAEGGLYDAETGEPLAGRTVTFEERLTPRSWTLTTATDGSWSHSFDHPVAVDAGTTVDYVASWPGDDLYEGYSASTT